MKKIDQLIKKYDRPVPRYTSYPSVPDWNLNSFSSSAWKESLSMAYETHGDEGISLYIHLPYCESLCTYCGCNTRITVNHEVELPYVQAVIKEFQLIKNILGTRPKLNEIHLGGGTPTFFSPSHLRLLIEGIVKEVETADNAVLSFEGHPNNTTKAHLQTLYALGFRRVSFGIQDSDPKVQKAINRMQPNEAVTRVTKWAREIGYTSVNFDLIYGLPFQTQESIGKTMQLVKVLRPDRIAFYSYAHVPWKRPGQRAYNDSDLPSPEEKHQLNQFGQALLSEMNYVGIGMDHFALADEELCLAMREKTLHRNFMGYTTNPGQLLIGLGVSAISDISLAYAQNPKTVEQYLALIAEEKLPQVKGQMMTPKEIKTKAQILEVACQQQVSDQLYQQLASAQKSQIDEYVSDGLLEQISGGYEVSGLGRQFLRNICSIFDSHHAKNRAKLTFSRSV